MLAVGLVGLPNVGKSTLLNVLAREQVSPVSTQPRTTTVQSTVEVSIPDRRLSQLHKLLQTKTKHPLKLKVYDIPALEKHASRGSGQGTDFLWTVRSADVLVHVVRVFRNPHVVHTNQDLPGSFLQVSKDIDVVAEELKQVNLHKPVLYVLNCLEEQLFDPKIRMLIHDIENKYRAPVVLIPVKLEETLSTKPIKDYSAGLAKAKIDHTALEQIATEVIKLRGLKELYLRSQDAIWAVAANEEAILADLYTGIGAQVGAKYQAFSAGEYIELEGDFAILSPKARFVDGNELPAAGELIIPVEN